MIADTITKIADFLNEQGIQLIEKKDIHEPFLPGLELGSDGIYVDYEELKYPGDLLHEAGHLAVADSLQRSLIGTAEMEKPWPTDGEEMGAILWSYAAAKEIGIPLEVLFHDEGYKGDSKWLRDTFETENYVGLPFLEWTGLAYGPEKAKEKGVEPFPNMVKWLRD